MSDGENVVAAEQDRKVWQTCCALFEHAINELEAAGAEPGDMVVLAAMILASGGWAALGPRLDHARTLACHLVAEVQMRTSVGGRDA